MTTFDTPRTLSMRRFLDREKARIVGLSIEPDGVFIYTDSSRWCDDAGSGTFRGDSETAAIRRFYERIRAAHSPSTKET
jgi:glucose/arabinose dehydrogenase